MICIINCKLVATRVSRVAIWLHQSEELAVHETKLPLSMGLQTSEMATVANLCCIGPASPLTWPWRESHIEKKSTEGFLEEMLDFPKTRGISGFGIRFDPTQAKCPADVESSETA